MNGVAAPLAPLAPWALAGESIVGLARWQGAAPVCPVGLTRMPGPSLVAATRYTDSPVGAFVELIIGHPARLGLWFGWMISDSIVTAEDARIGGRLNWGFPSERADLRWEVDGHERALVWPSRGFSMRGEPKGMPLPWLVPVRALQRRSDGCMIVPGHQRGRARFARISIEAKPDDVLYAIAGPHPGAMVSGLRATVHPARAPLGPLKSLVAPLRAPEPAVWCETPRAYSSVG